MARDTEMKSNGIHSILLIFTINSYLVILTHDHKVRGIWVDLELFNLGFYPLSVTLWTVLWGVQRVKFQVHVVHISEKKEYFNYQ